MLDSILNVFKNNGNQIFYKINDNYITYEEVYSKVNIIADNLKKQGNQPVILYGSKSINQVISIIACIVAKRCYIPVDVSTPYSKVKEIICSSKASLIIKNEEIKDFGIECLTLDNLNKTYKNINTYFKNDNKYAYIIYTSGSTGKSKGVKISYDNLDAFINWITRLEEFLECDHLNVLSQANFSFDLSVMDLYFSIYKNCHLFGIDNNTKSDLVKVYDVLNKENINFLIMTPTFVKMLLLDNRFNEENFKSIKYMFFCGETLEVEIVKKIKKRFKNITVINAYGPTEATCFVTLNKISDDMLLENRLPVGKISTSLDEIKIVSDIIRIKGISVFDGYVDTKSDDIYMENNINCYKTGDLGYIKKDYLYCIGRVDSQIKYQGYRIELGDIENNLLKIKEVEEAVVICKFKNDTVRLIKAFVTLNKEISENEIKRCLGEFLPKYMVPKSIVILDKIPINNNDKYDRRALLEYD